MEQLYSHHIYNLVKTGQFLWRYKLPELTLGEITWIVLSLLNKLVNFQNKKTSGTDGVTVKFMFSSRKIEVVRTLFFLWGQHYPHTKLRKRYHKKGKLQTNISHEYRRKNHQQNRIQQCIKNCTQWSSGVIHICKAGSTFKNQSL